MNWLNRTGDHYRRNLQFGLYPNPTNCPLKLVLDPLNITYVDLLEPLQVAVKSDRSFEFGPLELKS